VVLLTISYTISPHTAHNNMECAVLEDIFHSTKNYKKSMDAWPVRNSENSQT